MWRNEKKKRRIDCLFCSLRVLILFLVSKITLEHVLTAVADLGITNRGLKDFLHEVHYDKCLTTPTLGRRVMRN